MLQSTQEVYGYLPRLALHEISLQTGVSLSQIYGVSSFYNQFRLSPVGEHIIDVCHGTACHVAGARADHRGSAKRSSASRTARRPRT